MDPPLSRRQALHPIQRAAQPNADPAQNRQRQCSQQHRQGDQAVGHPLTARRTGGRQRPAGRVHRQKHPVLTLIEIVVGPASLAAGPEVGAGVLGGHGVLQVKAGAQLRPDSLLQRSIVPDQAPYAVFILLVHRYGRVIKQAAATLSQAVPQPLGHVRVVDLDRLEELRRAASQGAVRLPLGVFRAHRMHHPPHQHPRSQSGHRRDQYAPPHQQGEAEPSLLAHQEPQQSGQNQHRQSQPGQNQHALGRTAVEHAGEVRHGAAPVQQELPAVHQQQCISVPGHPQVGAVVHVIALFFQTQEGIGLPVGKIGKIDPQIRRVHIVNPIAGLCQLEHDLPIGEQGALRPVGADQLISRCQHQRAVGQGHGSPQVSPGHCVQLLQPSGGAGPLVKTSGISLEQRKVHHPVHLGKIGQAGLRHLILKVFPGTRLTEQQLRLPSLSGQAVDLQSGLLLGIVYPQIDRAAGGRVEEGRGAVQRDGLLTQRPALGPLAVLVPDHQLIAVLRPAKGVDSPLRVGGGERIVARTCSRPQDGQALRSQVPEQQNRASAQNGQKRHKNPYFFQSVHLPHLRFRRAAQCRKCPQSREHQRRKKLRFSSFS